MNPVGGPVSTVQARSPGAGPSPHPPGSVRARLLGVNPVNHPGGAETTLLRLARGLADRDWQVTLTTPGGGSLADAVVGSGLDWEPLPTGGLGARTGAEAVLSWRRLRTLSRDADVVLLNGAVTGRLLPALLGTPALSILDVNDMVVRAPRLWRRADVILADSQAVAARLRGLDPRLEPLVVGLPVDLDPPQAAAPWPSQVPDAPMIGYVGRIEPRKGVHDLLSAIPHVREHLPGARFVLIGEDAYGADRAYSAEVLARAADLGVLHLPWQANAPGLMRHLDVLVLPSHAEPFGTVLAEAMAVGTPVVASAVDGLVEVVEDGVSGRLVPPGQPDALAAGLLEVLARRGEMSQAATERARRWSTPDYVERISTLLSHHLGISA